MPASSVAKLPTQSPLCEWSADKRMRSYSRRCFHCASAREQLMALACMIHYLHSAVAVAQDGNVLFDANDNARCPSNNPMQEHPTSSGRVAQPADGAEYRGFYQ